MYTPDNCIIDNDNQLLFKEINKILEEQKNIDIATGFFNLGGFGLIAENLMNVNSCRLLLGKKPEFDNDNNVDTFNFYRYKLKESIENEEFSNKKELDTHNLLSFLKQEKVQVRIYEKSFLHGKAFIFDKLLIAGSSNFTYSGLTCNTELNSVSLEAQAKFVREEWFNKFWITSRDFKEELIELLEKSKFGTLTMPYEVYLKALYELQKDDILSDNLIQEDLAKSKVNLAEFQQDAVNRILGRLKKYNGVMVADAVGLGKTWIAKKVIEEFGFYRRKDFLVISPAQIRDRVWRNELKDLGLAENIISQEDIGNPDFENKMKKALGSLDKLKTLSLIVIDESHNFRNPLSNRYENLYSIIEKATTNTNIPKILLLTATPVNNSIWDLYFQLMLIARNNEKIFIRENVTNLTDFFKDIEKKGDIQKLDDVLHEISVRRTRQYIKKHYPEAEINGQRIIFPKRNLKTVSYKLNDTYKGLYKLISKQIEEDLTMAYYKLEDYKLTDQDVLIKGRMIALAGIFKTVLLKRLESSIEAFRISLRNQIEFLETFKLYLLEGKVIKKNIFNKYLINYIDSGEDLNLNLEEYLENIDLKLYDTDKLFADLDLDIEIYNSIFNEVKSINEFEDAKLISFKNKLLELKDQGKVLIFTYYSDTLNYIYKSLETDEKFQKAFNKKVEKIDGKSSYNHRDKIIGDFLDGNTNILLSTDILSEGQNLQKARCLINYDLHWNPTRMIQRAGRIDRIGSPFEEIFIYNFYPEDELETLLKLVKRLQQKIQDINNSIGLDASVLGETINPKVFGVINKIVNGTEKEKQEILEELEEEQFGGGEKFWEPLRSALEQKGLEWIEQMPNGIKSGLVRNFRGIFYYFQYDDEYNLWYLYDITTKEIITNKSQILDYISCKADEPRVIPDNIDIYVVYELIKEKIKLTFRNWQQQTVFSTSQRDEKMIKDIVLELDYIKDELEYYEEEKERIHQLNLISKKLEQISFTKRRWQILRKIWHEYKNNHKNYHKLEDDLIGFLNDKKILEQEIFEDYDVTKLKLICVDIIS